MAKLIVYKTLRCTQCMPFAAKLMERCAEEGISVAIKEAEEADVTILTVPTTVLYSDVEPPNIFPGVFNIDRIIEEVWRIRDKEDETDL